MDELGTVGPRSDLQLALTLLISCNVRSLPVKPNHTFLFSPWVFWLNYILPQYKPWLNLTHLICCQSIQNKVQ